MRYFPSGSPFGEFTPADSVRTANDDDAHLLRMASPLGNRAWPRVASSIVWLLASLIVSLAAKPAHAAAPALAQLLKTQFSASERVSYVDVTAAELKSRGLPTKTEVYHVYVGMTAGKVDGYVVVDDEIGQHEPITFAFVLDADGVLRGAQVLAYREAYGDAIKDPRFLAQLNGKTTTSPLTVGNGIDGISGATLSARATAKAAQRALVLVDLAKHKTPR